MGLCKRCYAELQTSLEEQRLLCNACFQQQRGAQEPEPRPAEEERPFCCASDPPCPSCPFVVGWE